MITLAKDNCENPICGCGNCWDPQEPEEDCPNTICTCGRCQYDEDENAQ